MKTSLRLIISLIVVFVSSQTGFCATSPTLTTLTNFGGHSDGSIQPLDQPWLDTASNQRGMACDPLTTNLVLVDTHSGSAGSNAVQGAIYVLNGATGATIPVTTNAPFGLDTNGISGGTYADASASIADDGVVYVCNQINNSTNIPFTIYRWDNITSSNPPVVAFNGFLSPAQRYGSDMSIRGAGPNTQIIIGSLPQGTSGTNVVIFTTVDGTNFTSHVLGTDVLNANFNEGIAFGKGNTFWAKRIGAPLLLMAFDLGSSTATTIRAFTSTNLAGCDNFGPLDVDTNNNLLAVVETTAGVPERVRLYDITDPTNNVPVFLDIKSYTPNNANATAPSGYVDFGPGRLYTHVINNGMVAYGVSNVTMLAPIVLSRPNTTNRIAVSQSITLSLEAYPFVHFQWRTNGVDIPNATNSSLAILNASTNQDQWLYTCVMTNAAGSTNVSSRLIVVNPADLFHLGLLWRVGPADAKAWLNNSPVPNVPNQRTIAYNSFSNHLYMISRSSNTTSNYVVHILNATNGTPVYPEFYNASQSLGTNGLSTNGIYKAGAVGAAGIGLVGIDVADDGTIYGCNVSTRAWGGSPFNADNYFRIYKWADGNTNTAPIEVFFGDPASQSADLRWGDSFAVRGSGINTRIVVDCNTREAANTVKKFAVLAPTDASCTTFTATWAQGTNSGAAPIGRSLEFEGNANAIWQKNRAGGLVRTKYDPTIPGDFGLPNMAFAVTTTYLNFTSTLCGMAFDNMGLNLLAGVEIPAVAAPDTLNLYDLTNPDSPLLLAKYSFPVAVHNANGNFITQTVFATNALYGPLVFALDANNGLMAFQVVSGPLSPPSFVTNPKNLRLIAGGAGTMTAGTLESADLQWQKNGGTGFTNVLNATNTSFSISNATLMDAATYRAIASNVFSGTGTSLTATVSVSLPQTNYSLATIWSNAIGSQPWLRLDAGGRTPFQRSLGYHKQANQLLVINRTSATANLTVNVIDPDTGTKLYELDTNGIANSADAPRTADNIILCMLAVADDGNIYAANVSMANNQTTNAELHVYRWTNSEPTTVPVLVYSGEPANEGPTVSLRWGDAMHIRGSGANTEIVFDNQRAAQSVAAVLVPTDASLNSFTNLEFNHNYGTLTIGRSLEFGPTNTIWQKAFATPLKLSRYDTNTQSSTLVSTYDVFPATVGGIYMDTTRKLAVGVDFVGVSQTTPDRLNLYEISDLSLPMLISTFNFPTNSQLNANHVTHAIFGGNKVFALDGNNGILALTLVPNLRVETANPFAVSWENLAGFTLQASPSLSTVTWTNVTTGTLSSDRYYATNGVSGNALFYRLKATLGQ